MDALSDGWRIDPADPGHPDAAALIAAHLAHSWETTPETSIHTLETDALRGPGMAFWLLRDRDGAALGCGALKELGGGLGEVKSIHTAEAARGRGVGGRIVGHIIAEARLRGYAALFLETGSMDAFAASRALYARHGFIPCPPFGDYAEDPNSAFMRLALD